MRYSRRWSSILLLVICAPIQSVLADSPLDLVPDDAGMVVAVGNLEKLADGMAAFGKAIGVDEMSQVKAAEMIDGAVMSTAGIKMDGPMVAAMRQTGTYPSMLLIIGISDAAAWKAAVSATEVEGQKEILKFSGHGDDAYAAIAGDLLVVSDEDEAVKAALRSKKTSAERFKNNAGDIYEKNQIAILVDVASFKKTIEEGLGQFEQMMQMGMAMSGGAQTEAGMGFVTAMLGGLRNVIRDTSIMTAGITVDGKGVRIADVCVFSSDSESAKYVKQIKKCDGHLLRGAIDGPFSLAFGCEWKTPEGVPALSEKMMRLVVESTAADSPQRKELETALAATIELGKYMTGYNGTLRLAETGQGMLFSGIYFTSKPGDTAKAMREMMSKSASFMNVFAAGLKAELERKPEKIGDVEVDAYELKLSGDDPNLASIAAVYGENPTNMVIPRKNDIAYVLGAHDAAKALAEKLLGDKATPLNENKRVGAALKELSPDPQVCVLLDLGEFIKFAMHSAAASGMPIPPLNFETDGAPLIAATAYVQGEKVRTELSVPAESVGRVVAGFKAMSSPEPK